MKSIRRSASSKKASSRPVPDRDGRPLPNSAVERLERFASRLERLSVEVLPTFASRSLDTASHSRAIVAAQRIAEQRNVEAALEAARQAMVDWVSRLHSTQQPYPEWVGRSLGRSSGTAGDRADVAMTLGDATVALALWDWLDEADREELLGAWTELVT
jgi:hypothetical protein